MIDGLWILIMVGNFAPKSALLYTSKADCEKQLAEMSKFDPHSKSVCVPTYADKAQLDRLFTFGSQSTSNCGAEPK